MTQMPNSQQQFQQSKGSPKGRGRCTTITGKLRSRNCSPSLASPTLSRESRMFPQCSGSILYENTLRRTHHCHRGAPYCLPSYSFWRMWHFLYQCDRGLTINRTEWAVKANWVIKILTILGFMGRKADKASFVILFPWICFIFHFYFLGRRDTDRTHSSLSGASPALTSITGEGQARTSTFQCNCFASAISFYHSWCKWRQVKGTWEHS